MCKCPYKASVVFYHRDIENKNGGWNSSVIAVVALITGVHFISFTIFGPATNVNFISDSLVNETHYLQLALLTMYKTAW